MPEDHTKGTRNGEINSVIPLTVGHEDLQGWAGLNQKSQTTQNHIKAFCQSVSRELTSMSRHSKQD